MAARRRHRTKRTDPGDQMVPINGDVLAAVIKEAGLKAPRLAQLVGTDSQNIYDMINSGPRRQCRAGLRAQIAAQLGVSEAFLAGEPVIYPTGPLVFPGYEYRYSPRTELAASRLLTKVAVACDRDLHAVGERSQSAPSQGTEEMLLHLVLGCVAKLIQVKDWREKLILWNPDKAAARGFTEPATVNWSIQDHGRMRPPRRKGVKWPRKTVIEQWQFEAHRQADPEHESGVLALIRAVEHLLKPWFEGDAQLNYDALNRLTDRPDEPLRMDSFTPAAINPLPERASAVSSPQSTKPTRKSKPTPVKKSAAERRTS